MPATIETPVLRVESPESTTMVIAEGNLLYPQNFYMKFQLSVLPLLSHHILSSPCLIQPEPTIQIVSNGICAPNIKASTIWGRIYVLGMRLEVKTWESCRRCELRCMGTSTMINTLLYCLGEEAEDILFSYNQDSCKVMVKTHGNVCKAKKPQVWALQDHAATTVMYMCSSSKYFKHS